MQRCASGCRDRRIDRTRGHRIERPGRDQTHVDGTCCDEFGHCEREVAGGGHDARAGRDHRMRRIQVRAGQAIEYKIAAAEENFVGVNRDAARARHREGDATTAGRRTQRDRARRDAERGICRGRQQAWRF